MVAKQRNLIKKSLNEQSVSIMLATSLPAWPTWALLS
jgi:hypothetical protein